jgi:outer membrane protein assembly factor BamB
MLLLTAVLLLSPPGDVDSASQWRGPKRDGLSAETGLLQRWPEGGPRRAWKVDGLGGGWSSVSVHGGRIYTMGDAGDACRLFALDATDGRTLWSVRVGAPGGHNRYPGSRSTPSTDGKVVVALGQQGDLVAVAAEDGKELWRTNFEKDLGGRMMSGWRWSESPLLDGGRVICTPGGDRGTVLALDAASGKPVWRTQELKDEAAYCAPVPAEIGGVKQYLVLTGASVSGVAAADGKLLWRTERPGSRAVVPEPLHKGDTVFVASGYGVGCNAYRITASGGTFSLKELYKGGQIANHHGGMILLGDHVYGVDDKGSLKCLELATGATTWSSPPLGKGSLAYADGRLYYRSEKQNSPVLILIEATPEGYREHGRFTPPSPSGVQAWAHPVIAGGRLFLRDQGTLFAYDVKAE